jgi:hypothetical protein
MKLAAPSVYAQMCVGLYAEGAAFCIGCRKSGYFYRILAQRRRRKK